MALTKISGNVVQQNNFSLSGVVTATSFTGDLTGNVTATTVQVGSATTIHTTGIDLGSGNINSHNINSTGIITATGGFVGAVTGNLSGNVSGTAVTATTASFTNATISGDLTVQGTTTTLDTTLTEVDRLEVGANNTTVGVAITQSGTGDILRLYDSSTQVVTVADGGSVGIGTDNPAEDLHIQKSRADVLIEGTNDTVNGNVANLSLMAPYYRKVGYSIKDSAGNEDFFIGRPYGQGDSNPDLVINMTGTEKVRIKNNGNVGIGTDNPATELEVYGDARFKDVDGSHGIELYPDVAGLGYQRIISYNRTTSAYENLSIGVNDFVVTTGSSSERLRIDSNGHITAPNQPCFAAWRTTAQSYTVNDIVVFNNERFDNNSDYNTSTGEFTAPVTGKYLMLATVLVETADVGDQFDIRLYTSNQTYYGAPGRIEVQLGTSWTNGSGNNYIALGVQHIVDMDANDVASIRFTTFEGGAIYGTNAGDWTRFAGYLLC